MKRYLSKGVQGLRENAARMKIGKEIQKRNNYLKAGVYMYEWLHLAR